MKLSENFFLYEFLRSEAATRHDIDMTPPQFVIDNLKSLVVTVLQPLRTQLDRPLVVTSGYRPPKLNKLIGGSKTSAHRTGQAADFHINAMTPYDTCQAILEMDLVFDQLIHEFAQWVHVGISPIARQQEMTAIRQEGKTVYLPGIIEVGE